MSRHWILAKRQARSIKRRKRKKAAAMTLFKHLKNALKAD